nr:ribbon-helix-helix domain-containing protein [Mesorhizobium soli]
MFDQALSEVPSTDLQPEFRVVSHGGARRGLRLERLFWKVLKRVAESRKSTLGAMVDEIAKTHGDSKNATSAIRVTCIRWLTGENAELSRLASIKTVNSILGACPSPAFTLSSSKRILNFNAPFQQLVRQHLPQGSDGRQDLKLSLDLSLPEIFSKLDANLEGPVVTGFVLGAGDRRYRGQINAVRAPVMEPELLMAFVSRP